MSNHHHPALLKFCSEAFSDIEGSLEHQVSTRRLESGEALFRSGDPADALYLLLDGLLAVHKGVGIGDRTQVVALLSGGTVVGEGAIEEGSVRTATVVAVEPSVLVVLTTATLAELRLRHPDIYIYLLRRVLSVTLLRLQKSSERLSLVL